MTDLTRVSITCTVEAALKKLKKGQIAVFDVKKEGASLIFSVNDKDLKKVFAIFDKPCYNISVKRRSFIKRLSSFLCLRAGLVAGAALFAVAAIIANTFILKIDRKSVV